MAVQVLRHTGRLAPKIFRAYNYALKRLSPEYTATTYFGAYVRCDLNDLIQRTIYHFGLWEPNNSAVVESILKPGDVFVDVGANVGYYSLLASRLVGRSGRVIAIEASPSIFAQFSSNLLLNNVKNVVPINVAASDVASKLNVYRAPRTNQGRTSTAPESGYPLEATVDAVPLDELISPEDRARTKLVKVDVEGAELPILQRLLATLDKFGPNLHVIAEMSGDNAEAFRGFLDRDYQAFAIENRYDIDWYLSWKRAAPRRIHDLPEEQTDVLFRPA